MSTHRAVVAAGGAEVLVAIARGAKREERTGDRNESADPVLSKIQTIGLNSAPSEVNKKGTAYF